jgi:Brp/Blh family beta-carotene 15,15'-monooxygenase
VIAAPGELALLAVAVFLVGTPHGALDARLAREFLPPLFGRHWLKSFICAYLVLAGSVLALWFAAPVAAIGLFLLLSVVHFGEHDSPSGRWPHVVTRGALPPVLAAAFHPDATATIFELLAGPGGGTLAGLLGGPVLIIWLAGAALTLVEEKKQKAELVLLAALFAIAPPLIAFSLYFALIHTPRALAGSRRPGERWRDLLRAAMPWSLAALALAFALWAWFAPQVGEAPAFLRTTFWWLSALTVPHMLLHLIAHKQSVARADNIARARLPAKTGLRARPERSAELALLGPISLPAPTPPPAASSQGAAK